MAVIKCPECGHNVASDAPTCPGCGKLIAKPKAKTGCMTIGCAGVLVLFFCIWLMNALSPHPPAGVAAPAGPDWVDIKTKCQMAIETKLKAPSSAKFNWGERTQFTDKDPGRAGLGFVGTVDSQNSFGAMIRTRFRCWIRADEATVLEFDK